MILQRGDIIHLAMPSGGVRADDDANVEKLRNWYAMHGIDAQVISHHRNATTTQIVAVIRNTAS